MSSLDLDALAPDDRLLTVTHAGAVLSLPIRGSMPMTKMIRLLRLETRLNLAYSGEGEETLIDVFESVYSEVMALIRERTPDCPDLDLNEDQALAVIAFIAGGDSVAQEVTDAITPPDEATKPRTEEQVTAEGRTPLASPTASQERSSGSESSTDGDPSGGSESPGVRSGLTSDELTPV